MRNAFGESSESVKKKLFRRCLRITPFSLERKTILDRAHRKTNGSVLDRVLYHPYSVAVEAST